MNSRIFSAVVGIAALLQLGCARSWSPLATNVIKPKDTLAMLSSDKFQGRGVGTEGLDLAADQIGELFRRVGLQPAPGSTDFTQRFQMTYKTTVDSSTSLSLADSALEAGKDFIVNSQSGEKDFAGDVVFAGYGISSDEQKYNDYANVDVKGKVVLVLRFEPHDENGKSRFTHDTWSDLAGITNKARLAAEKGAVAMLFVQPPMHHASEPLMPFARTLNMSSASIPIIQISQDLADKMLARGFIRDLKSLQKAIDDTGKPASATLADVKVSGSVKLFHEKREVRNVVGMLRGNGATADEYIVVGAHYDHLGMRKGLIGATLPSTQPTVHSPEVYHGADDNASGTVAMLQIADILAKQPANKRSILFVAFTAEESGLIGSRHFVDHPPVPLDKIVAMLNLDMVGRVRDDKLYISGQGTAEAFKKILADANAHSPLKLSSIGEGGIAPSDNTSFALKRIPVLFFFSGLHADYHRPSDEFEKINFMGIDMVVGFSIDVVRAMTDMPRQKYNDLADAKMIHITGGGPTSRVSLGVMPNYATEGAEGVLIDGTIPGSPAAQAGLKAGDVLIGLGSKKISSIYDLTDVLQSAKANVPTSVKFVRGGKVFEVPVTLVEKKQ